MFKAKGVVTLVRTNTLTGKVEEEIVKENVFTTYGMRRAMNLTSIPDGFRPYNHLMISQQSTTPSKGNELVTQIIGDADSSASIPNPNIWVDESETLPMYGEIRRRLDFQGQPRTFRTILVGDRTARNAPGYPNAGNFNNWNSNLRAGQGNLKAIPAYCYLLLDSPVTQNAFDIIDIFYRVYFIPANGNGVPKNSELVRNIGRRLFGFTSTNPGTQTDVFTSPCSFTNAEDYNFVFNPNIDDSSVVSTFNNVSLLGGATYSYDEASVNYFTSSTSLAMLTGRLIRSGSMGRLERTQYALTARDFLDPQRTPLQTSWAKREGGRPFFSENDFSIGQGRIIPSVPLEWEEKYPEFFRVLITKSGDIGEAEYRFESQRFVSYARNTWTPVPAPVLHTGGVVWDFRDIPFLPNSYGTDQKVKLELVSDDTLVFWNERGISLVNIVDSTKFRSLGADTAVVNPLDKLDVEDIRQVVVKDEFVYIACSVTGIWKVDTSKELGEAGYVSHPFAGNAYAITRASFQGVLDIYAVTSSGITFEGSNWSTFFNPSSPRLDLYGLSSILTMCGNENHTDGQIALLSVISGESQIVWWSRTKANGLLVDGQKLIYDNDNLWLNGTPNCIQCSESADFFALTYSTSSSSRRWYSRAYFDDLGVEYMGYVSETQIRTGDLIIPARNGNKFFVHNNGNYNSSSNIQYSGNVRAFDENSSATNSVMYDFATDVETIDRYRTGGLEIGGSSSSYTNRGKGFRIVHLGRDLYYYTGYLITPFSYEWEQYGWNGTEWEKGITTSKVTHELPEDLIHGIQIQFDDREQDNPFFATDFYTLPVANGALGDNAKTITASLKVLASDFRYQVAFPTGNSVLTVPSVNPYQITVPGASEGGFDEIVVLDESTFLIALDGQRVPFNQILTDGSTPPSPNFVSITKSTGVLTFHPSDINREISGYYSYNLEL